jgi:hypothetical protein
MDLASKTASITTSITIFITASITASMIRAKLIGPMYQVTLTQGLVNKKKAFIKASIKASLTAFIIMAKVFGPMYQVTKALVNKLEISGVESKMLSQIPKTVRTMYKVTKMVTGGIQFKAMEMTSKILLTMCMKMAKISRTRYMAMITAF